MTVAIVGLLLAPAGIVQARWKVIADNAVDPIRVCTDGIIFDYVREGYSEFTDYSTYAGSQVVTFKAATPPPFGDDYPAPGTIIAARQFHTYLFSGAPWGIDVDDPPNSVPDNFYVYRGVSATPWAYPLNPGTEVRITFADFDTNQEVATVEIVEACSAFSIDIRVGAKSRRHGSAAGLEVAVLRQPGVNPLHIIGSSVRFGPTGVEAAPIGSRYVDVDRDGDTDRVFQFDAGLLRSLCTNRLGILTAQLSTGGAFIGTDTLWASQCRGLGN